MTYTKTVDLRQINTLLSLLLGLVLVMGTYLGRAF